MKENVEKSMFYLTKERRESKYKILLFALIIMLFSILNSSKVYATGKFDVKNSLQGNEVTSFENSMYEMQKDENGNTTGILDCFDIIEEYTSYDEMKRYLQGGGNYGEWYSIVDNTIDYKGKYFMLCTIEYVGRYIKMENIGQFEYVDRFQTEGYETYIYLLEIANNSFKKDNGKHSYFEIIATDVKTNDKYLNKLEIEFRGKIPEQPEQPKPEQPKPEQPKPEQPEPEQPEPEQPKPEQPKSDEITSTDNKVQNQHKLDNEPKTGIINIVTIVSAIIGISSICFVICKKNRGK